MDLSKLPRMSNTSTPQPGPGDAPPPTDSPPPQPPAMVTTVPVAAPPSATSTQGTGAEAWISIALGLILLFIQPFPKYAWSVVTRHAFDTGLIDSTTGEPLAYRSLPQYWSDLSVSVFGLVLLLDGVVIGLTRRPAVVAAALCLTLIGTLMNLAYVVLTYRDSGLAILSAVAVAVGGYIALSQWRLLAMIRASRAQRL